MKYKYILWDIDDTLVDFKKSEAKALKESFQHFNVNISDDDLKIYSKINDSYWKRLEKGEVIKSEMLVQRFLDFFEYIHVSNVDAKLVNEMYQRLLGEKAVLFDESIDVLEDFKGKYDQYAITNGSLVAQTLKLKNTGIEKYFKNVFISELMGHEKPTVDYFNRCFENIKDFDPTKAIIIGDSLTSDIKGANNVGIDCIWFNRYNKVNDDHLKINYEVHNLKEILRILGD